MNFSRTKICLRQPSFLHGAVPHLATIGIEAQGPAPWLTISTRLIAPLAALLTIARDYQSLNVVDDGGGQK
jgi:hypothetical protein